MGKGECSTGDFVSVKLKSVSRLLPVSDRMYPCEKDVIISLLFSFNICLVLHYRHAVFFLRIMFGQ